MCDHINSLSNFDSYKVNSSFGAREQSIIAGMPVTLTVRAVLSFSTRRQREGKKTAVDRDRALLITSSVPVEKSFHFFTDVRKPVGMFATSIFEFADQLKNVDARSIEFHIQRNDFTKWLREVVRDDWLAAQFEKLQQLKLTGEKLRAKVVEVTDGRCRELTAALSGIR